MKPYLTFPFLWAAIVILIFYFHDPQIRQSVSTFLIPAIAVLIIGVSFTIYYFYKHTKSKIDFVKKLVTSFFLLFWIPISVSELLTLYELFYSDSFRNEAGGALLPKAFAITGTNLLFLLYLIIRKHKRK